MTAAAAWPAGMVIERDVAIPMADGVALAADIFRPSAGPPVPVIMSMGPYGKGTWFRDWQRAEWDGLITRHPKSWMAPPDSTWSGSSPIPNGGCRTATRWCGWTPGAPGGHRGTWTACPRRRPRTSARPSSGPPRSRR